MIVLVDNGHGSTTIGKCSPDRKLLEYAWAREIAKRIVARLIQEGINARCIVPENTDVPINTRLVRINRECIQQGSKNVLLVSIHCNAGVVSEKTIVKKDKYGYWLNSHGWSVFVSKNASAASKHLAAMMTDKAVERKMTGNRFVPPEKYWTWPKNEKKDIAILSGSACPAVLTENYFQDNLDDCAYLLSEEGKKAIVEFHVECIKEYVNGR